MAIEFTEVYLQRITENAEQSKIQERQIKELESDIKDLKKNMERLYDIQSTLSILAEGVKTIKEDVKEIKDEQVNMKSEIQEIKETPSHSKAKLVDNIKQLAITAIVSGGLAFLLAQVFPNIFK